MGTGLSEEKAFIKATDKIGTAEFLHDDSNIVNKMKVISERIFLCLCGYIFIVYMSNIIKAITFGIILPFEKDLADVPSKVMTITGSILIDISFSLSGIFENILNLMPIITFICCLYKKYENSKDFFWIIGGYLMGRSFTNIIPKIVDNTMLFLNINGIVLKIVYLTLYILIIEEIIYTSIFISSKVYINTNNKHKSSIDKSKKVKILLGLSIFITYGIVLVIVPIIHLKELFETCAMSFIVDVMAMQRITNIIIIILVQVMVNVMLIKRVKLKKRIA